MKCCASEKDAKAWEEPERVGVWRPTSGGQLLFAPPQLHGTAHDASLSEWLMSFQLSFPFYTILSQTLVRKSQCVTVFLFQWNSSEEHWQVVNWWRTRLRLRPLPLHRLPLLHLPLPLSSTCDWKRPVPLVFVRWQWRLSHLPLLNRGLWNREFQKKTYEFDTCDFFLSLALVHLISWGAGGKMGPVKVIRWTVSLPVPPFVSPEGASLNLLSLLYFRLFRNTRLPSEVFNRLIPHLWLNEHLHRTLDIISNVIL